MRKRIKQYFLSLILILSLSACNLQLVESSNDEGILLTITANAQIIEQAGQPVQTEPPAQEQIVVVVTATDEAGPAAPPPNEEVNPAQVLPPAVGDVTVSVTTATNCRKGPGQNFGIVYGMPVGQVAKVIARNSYSGYWIIEIPGQAGQTCWLWGQYAVINGDTSTLKEVVTPTSPAPTITNTPKPTNTIQPTATNTTAPVATKPNAPSGLTGTVICSPTQFPNLLEYAISLTWVDNSNNEDNFNISTPQSLDQVSANTTSYSLTALNIPGTILTVNVTAQNSAGSSAAISKTFVCP